MGSASNDSDPDTAGPSLKRKKCQDQWKKEQRKTKRGRGEVYTSVRGSEVAPKQVGPPCSCNYKCYEVLGMDHIQIIFDNFYGMTSHDKQTQYLADFVTSREVKRSRVKGRPARTLRTFKYVVKKENKIIEVCRTAFLHIHAVSEKRVRNAVDKAMRSSTGIVTPDQRGRHVPGNKLEEEKVNTVKEHILSLKTVSSHYTRAKSPNRRYLPPGLNRKLVYELYKEWMEKENKGTENIVKEWKYLSVLDSFNIGFEPPKSDSCNLCDEIAMKLRDLDPVADEEEISATKMRKTIHESHARLGQQILKDISGQQNQPHVAVICIDLQQTLPTPKLATGLQYYKRKMWTYDFCIHNVKERKGTMYVWNETSGKRGSSEVASCLDHYVTNVLDPHFTNLVIFSDNCSGQNKNKNVILACLRMIHSGRFVNVKHFFMVPGHSYLPCDRDFGVIELKLRPIPVFTTDHYINIIKKANRINPFNVVAMNRLDFKDYEALHTTVSWAGMKDAHLLQSRVLIYSDKYKEGLEIQEHYGALITKKVCLEKKKVRGKLNLANLPLPPKYPETVLLSPEKLADLKILMVYVEPQYKSFFTDLIAEQERVRAAMPIGSQPTREARGRGRGRGGHRRKRAPSLPSDDESDIFRLVDDPDFPSDPNLL